MADENEDKFDSQTFLLAYLDQLMPQLQKKVRYKNIYLLDTTEENPTSKVVGLLTNKTKGASSFTKLKTHQYNSLIPKVTLYRVDQANDGTKTEREFVFPKDYRRSDVISDLSNGFFIRGNNCGIKNIKWEVAGTDPVSAEKTISTTIDFYFDSINSFSGGYYELLKLAYLTSDDLQSASYSKFNTPKTTTNYWSLIFHPSFKGKSLGISQQEDVPKDYDTTKFRIKCVVGWNDLDPNIRKELFKDVNGIEDTINILTTSMYLNLMKHEFKFNEDGSLLLSATYVASLENSLRSDKFDLLGGLKEQLSNLKFVSGDSLTVGLSNAEVDAVINSNEDTTSFFESFAASVATAVTRSSMIPERVQADRVRNLNTQSSADDLRRTLEIISNPNCANQQVSELLKNTTDPNKIKEELIKQLDVVTTLIDKQEELRKKKFYSKFLKTLLLSDGVKNNTFYLTINEQHVKQFLSWRKNPVSLTRVLGSFGGLAVSDPQILQGKLDDLSKKINDKNPKLDQEIESTPPSETKTIEKIIHFTTIGSLIDTAIEVVKDNIKNNQDDLKEFQRFKIMLGNFSTEAPLFQAASVNFTDQISKNLAHLPIDIDRFLLFYSSETMEKSVTSYPFFIFFKNLINKLIYSSLNAEDIDNKEINKYADVSLAGIVINLGNTEIDNTQSYLDKIVGGERIIKSSDLTEEDLKPFYIKNNYNSNHKEYINIYFLFDKFQKDYFGKGVLADDEAKGIYHYTIAQDYGLIKSINFKRIDQPFQKEAKAVGKKTFFLGQFRDIYNVEIKMIGNNLYYPGMMLFVKPSIELGNPAKKNSFSQITGIGGYFQVIKVSSIITEDVYETILDCVYQSSGGEDRNKKSVCEENKDYEPGSALVLPIANSILSLAEQIKKLEEEEEDQPSESGIGTQIAVAKAKFNTLYDQLDSKKENDLYSGGNSYSIAIELINEKIGKQEVEKIRQKNNPTLPASVVLPTK